jgi:hypothetical protein
MVRLNAGLCRSRAGSRRLFGYDISLKIPFPQGSVISIPAPGMTSAVSLMTIAAAVAAIAERAETNGRGAWSG